MIAGYLSTKAGACTVCLARSARPGSTCNPSIWWTRDSAERPSTVPRLISRTSMHAAHETLQPRHHLKSNHGIPLGISHTRTMSNHFPGLTPWLLVLGYIKGALPPAGGTLSFPLLPSPCPAASFLFISLCDLRPPTSATLTARWSTT